MTQYGQGPLSLSCLHEDDVTEVSRRKIALYLIMLNASKADTAAAISAVLLVLALLKAVVKLATAMASLFA
jgi:hypothetical protein